MVLVCQAKKSHTCPDDRNGTDVVCFLALPSPRVLKFVTYVAIKMHSSIDQLNGIHKDAMNLGLSFNQVCKRVYL